MVQIPYLAEENYGEAPEVRVIFDPDRTTEHLIYQHALKVRLKAQDESSNLALPVPDAIELGDVLGTVLLSLSVHYIDSGILIAVVVTAPPNQDSTSFPATVEEGSLLYGLPPHYVYCGSPEFAHYFTNSLVRLAIKR